MNGTAQPFAEWIGRRSESEDVVTGRLVRSFEAIFRPHLAAVGDGVAPLGLHWCLSPAIVGMDDLGPDGHPAKNLSLPPVPQPRRMWAGGWIDHSGEIRLGDTVKRTSTIAGIDRKQGRSGELWFVAVEHVYETERGVAVRERQDIVYREAGRAAARAEPAADAGAAPSAAWSLVPGPTMLFRYSAITFNGHRIHYDLPYAKEVEGYAGLVVHGPLQATLLLNLAAATRGAAPARFAYRGLAPAIAGERLNVRADPDGMFRTAGPQGQSFMEASAE